MQRIAVAEPVFNGNEKKYLTECIDTGWVSANGRFIDEFQKKFAEYVGTKHAVACSNGTVSLQLIMKAMRIGEGDEVVMPALTYIATANAAADAGARPVFVDSDPAAWNIDPEAVEAAITERTAAIIPVHLYGLSCDMEALTDISHRYGIPLIEDAAEAHGAEWDGRKAGSIGKAGSFSFFGNKIITCGEGGMVTTDDDDLYRRLMLFRSQGVDPKKQYWHVVRGYNYRMTNMQAAVGLGQLERIGWHVSERKRVFRTYRKMLVERLGEYVRFQETRAEGSHVYWMTSILFTDEVKTGRDDIIRALSDMGIETRPVFCPMHRMPAYRDLNASFPVAEQLGERGINLPSHSGMDEERIACVVGCLERVIKGH